LDCAASSQKQEKQEKRQAFHVLNYTISNPSCIVEPASVQSQNAACHPCHEQANQTAEPPYHVWDALHCTL
jgi:hypothetical protein